MFLSFFHDFVFSLQVYETACDFGSGLLQEGLEPKNDTFIGIYSINRAEVRPLVEIITQTK